MIGEKNKLQGGEELKEKPVVLSNGVRVLNCTPHALKFEDGTVVMPSGYLLQAKMEEKQISECVYEVRVIPTEEGKQELRKINKNFRDVIVMGSAISAQAYPGKVKMPVLIKNRVKVSEKICRIDKFSVYPERR